MTRYLTASKVGLLTLIIIYTDGVIPNSSIAAIVSFLLSQIIPDSNSSLYRPVSDSDHVVPVSAFESALAPHASAVVGRTVWDVFLKKLWAIDCQAAFDSFIDDLPSLLAKSKDQTLKEKDGNEAKVSGKIARVSPFGAFIRRCSLEYTRLQFVDCTILWQNFINYRAPTRPAWEKRNPPDGRSALDTNLSDFNVYSNHPLAKLVYCRLDREGEQSSGFSTHDIESLMEFQVSELQRIGGRMPDEMRSKINHMSEVGASLPKLGHYLKFLDSWRMGDYTSAYDNLRRYFDYTMQNKDRVFYQYALLNLAILQADFGCYDQALPAMQEAIATARENKDTTCLNFCMSWLYHFGRTFPAEMAELRARGVVGSETESLAFLKSRAKDAEMWSLLSTCHLTEAKLALQTGASLSVVFEAIAQASHVNIIKSVASGAGPALLMKGSVFGRLGLSHLAWSCEETFLECYSDDAPAEDLVKSTCRMALLLTQRGRYNDATTMIENFPPSVHRVLKYQQYTTFCSGMLKLRRYLHRNDLNAAISVIQRLQGQGPPDSDLKLSLGLLEVDLNLRRGRNAAALKIVRDLAESPVGVHADIRSGIVLINTKAAILMKCGHPLKGLTIILRACQMARRAHILPAWAQAINCLADILVQLCQYAQACFILLAGAPQVLEAQDCALSASMYRTLVEAYMGLAGQEEIHSTQQKQLLTKAVEFMDLANEQYRRIEDLNGQLDMLSKMAKVMHLQGDRRSANDMASKWLALKKEYREMEV